MTGAPAPRAAPRWWPAGVLAATAAVVLALYWRTLGTFFLFDDLASLAIATPQGGKSWTDCLQPELIGFWRPLGSLTTYAVATLFGLRPLAFDLATLAIHVGVCVLCASVARRCFGLGPRGALAAALLMASHIGAWRGVVLVCNTGDTYVAAGFLLGLLAWDRALCAPPGGGTRAREAFGRHAPVFGAFAFCLMAKETGVVLPALLLLWLGVRRGRAGRGHAMVLAAVFVGALAFAAWAAAQQAASRGSYISEGYLRLHPVTTVRSTTDYVVSAFFPYLHTVRWPWADVAWPGAVLWGARLALLAAAAGAAARLWVRRAGSPGTALCAFALLAAFVAVALPGLRPGAPSARFVYPAVPFVVLLVVTAGSGLRGAWRAGATALVAVVWATFVAGFLLSPTVTGFPALARENAAFVEALRREAPAWPDKAVVSVFGYPVPGPNTKSRWGYLQHTLSVFGSGRGATAVLDDILPETTNAYRWTPDWRLEVVDLP